MICCTWQAETMDEDLPNVHEKVYNQNSVIHVCDCQILSDINNRTDLSATANT